MMILPVSGLLMTPEVHYYFQKDYIERLTKEKAQQDEDVLFLIMKEDKKPEEMTAEDFYPVGLMGTVTEVESDGSISVQAKYRVDAEVLGYEDGKWDVSCSLRPDIADMDEQSREQAYKEVQGALLQFVDGFQWGIVARNYVLRWKNLEEMCVALSYQLGLSDEEKYAILAADSLSERYRLMEKAVYEFIEVSRVSADAQEAKDRIQREAVPGGRSQKADRHPPEGAGRDAPGERDGCAEVRDEDPGRGDERDGPQGGGEGLKPHEAGGGEQPRVRDAL